ncbi:iron-containing alcohol dehydrogenase [Paenibacillus sp. BSR1-1]|uniref:iron-containing alcohol dehydrogenase n=1 Tax=Paenibacillus sp. BSR1-1 TaxID=3020845 RepID=UPI0025B08B36|nr:iron-containing alcohol dehydrogenase [Paenibacillus sp. BSR1-1]MDN3016210.1 iron-containing alcohol dehydrogenase [Paenibacillus sp. BSR1-1]
MESYSYFNNTRIEMGLGKAEQLPMMLNALQVGRSVLLVSDPGVVKAGLVTPIKSTLEESGYRVVLFDSISQNPRDTECLAGAKIFQEQGIETVVAVGGGSAMDTGKAIALLGPNGGTPVKYVEGKREYANIAPIICVPTTAGTGSEVTRSSVITESATHRKLTLKDASLRPMMAVLDPRLTFTVPQSVTAATGVDALVHAIEGYTCKITNPISQAFGARAMTKIVTSLPAAFKDGENQQARYDMLEGSLLAGLCFGSTDVAAVHCLAEALGGLYDTPHGVANAVFLPYVLKFNAEEEKGIHADLARYMKFANESDSDESAVEKLLTGIREFTTKLEIPKLKDLPGIRKEDFSRIVELAVQNNSTPSNIRNIRAEDYWKILEQAYEDIF